MFEALAINAIVIADSSSTDEVAHVERPAGLRACQSANHAATPVASMKTSASSAALWCTAIKSALMPGFCFITASATWPVMYVANETSAMAKKSANAPRNRSSLFLAKASSSTPRATMVPTVGT